MPLSSPQAGDSSPVVMLAVTNSGRFSYIVTAEGPHKYCRNRQTSHPGAPHVRSDNHRATAFLLALVVCASCAGGRTEIAALAAHAPPYKGMGCYYPPSILCCYSSSGYRRGSSPLWEVCHDRAIHHPS